MMKWKHLFKWTDINLSITNIFFFKWCCECTKIFICFKAMRHYQIPSTVQAVRPIRVNGYSDKRKNNYKITYYIFIGRDYFWLSITSVLFKPIQSKDSFMLSNKIYKLFTIKTVKYLVSRILEFPTVGYKFDVME